MYYDTRPVDKAWYRVEIQAVQSSEGVADGSVEIWHTRPDGTIKKVVDRANILTRNTGYNEWVRIAIGEGYTNGITTGTTYFDDVYLDNTWARVVIGDSSTYEDCTIRETQIPSAWSDTSITVTFNQGSFSEGTVYLYVIDADGVPSAGFAISIGEEAGDTTPPYVDQRSPADEATDVSIDTAIICHIKDAGDGVDTDTIVMTVNSVEVEPVITGTAADYTLTYTPGASLEYSTEYTASVDGDDLMGNSMTTVEWTFTTAAAPDTTPPTADTFDPADEATDVSVLTTISCHVKDAGDGVDESSIVMTLNDVEVDTVITGTSADFTVTHTPAAPLDYSTLYTASVDADDLAE